VRNRVAIIAGGAAAAAAVAYGLLRRRPAPARVEHPEPVGPDPRAEALREKLAASRELAGERDAFEEAETPVDEAVAPESAEDVEERRRSVHDRGRAAAEEMRRGGAS
jgi:hypothetical protein